jgi:hypothetical protein
MQQDDSLWHALEEIPTRLKDSDPDMATRLERWLKRFAFCEQLYTADSLEHKDRAVKKLLHWRNKATHEAKQLRDALEAWIELHSEEHKAKEHHHHVSAEIFMVIHKKMLKLEIIQLRLLQKAQHLPRPLEGDLDLQTLNDELHNARNTLNNWETFRKKQRLIPYLRLYKTNPSKATLFLYRRSRRVRLKPILNTSRYTASTIEFGNAITTLVARIIDLAQHLLPFVMAIPFVNAFASAVPVLTRAIAAFVKKQSNAKKRRGVALILLFIASISLMFLTAAGLGFIFVGGVATALMAIGTYIKYIDPYLKQRAKLKKQEAEYRLCQAIHGDILEGKDPLQNPKAVPFIQAYLFSKVEEKWVCGEIDDTKRDEYIACIRNHKIDTLDMQMLCGATSLTEALQQDLPQYEEHYQTLLPELRKQKNRAQAYALTGSINMLGVILMLVPTPPTLILGATCLVIGSITGLVLTFELDIKIKRLFVTPPPSRKSTPPSSPPPPNPHAKFRGAEQTSTLRQRHKSESDLTAPLLPPSPPLSSPPPSSPHSPPPGNKPKKS